jgi:hypothetical protein
MRSSNPRFFRQSITPRPHINTLKYFRILFQICRDNQLKIFHYCNSVFKILFYRSYVRKITCERFFYRLFLKVIQHLSKVWPIDPAPLLMWGPAIEKEGVSFQWLNAANSNPTSWKCGVVRGPHGGPKNPGYVPHIFVSIHRNRSTISMFNLGIFPTQLENI